jgi:hypothetical protein
MEELLWGALVVAIAGAVVFAEYRRQASWRAIKKARPIAIASLQEGQRATIAGVIAPRGPLLTSPIQQLPCIGYSSQIDVHRGEEVQPFLKADDCGPFFVTDESGTALVYSPVLLPRPPGSWQVAPPTSLPTTAGEENRCYEILLRPGDRVKVLGRSVIEVDPAAVGGPHRQPPMLPVLKGSADEPVIVADADATKLF